MQLLSATAALKCQSKSSIKVSDRIKTYLLSSKIMKRSILNISSHLKIRISRLKMQTSLISGIIDQIIKFKIGQGKPICYQEHHSGINPINISTLYVIYFYQIMVAAYTLSWLKYFLCSFHIFYCFQPFFLVLDSFQ